VLEESLRRFEYSPRTDDGNPSVARWTWSVDETAAGTVVTVTWQLCPATFWRRALLGRIRQHQLAASELPASLQALGNLAATEFARDL